MHTIWVRTTDGWELVAEFNRQFKLEAEACLEALQNYGGAERYKLERLETLVK